MSPPAWTKLPPAQGTGHEGCWTALRNKSQPRLKLLAQEAPGCRSLAQHLREAMLHECPFLMVLLLVLLLSILGMALYTATTQEKGGEGYKERKQNDCGWSIKAARVKNDDQGTRHCPRAFITPQRSQRTLLNSVTSSGNENEPRSPYLIPSSLTASSAKARQRACNLGPQTRARLIQN